MVAVVSSNIALIEWQKNEKSSPRTACGSTSHQATPRHNGIPAFFAGLHGEEVLFVASLNAGQALLTLSSQ